MASFTVSSFLPTLLCFGYFSHPPYPGCSLFGCETPANLPDLRMVIERSRRRVKPAQDGGEGGDTVTAARGRMGGAPGGMRGFGPGEE